MDTQKKGKTITFIGYVVLVIGLLVGRLIMYSSSDAEPTMLNEWIAGRSPLNIIVPLLGIVIIIVGMRLQRSK